jgi:hypothetical protein
MNMKRIVLFVMVWMLLAACGPSIKVTYDYDGQADFAKYKTYAFSEDALKLPVNDLNRDRVLKAVETEMAAKGFTKSDNPDVWIDLHIKAEKKTEATATTTGTGMYGGGYYGGPWRYGYGGGFSTTQINYNDYIEGTLFVNMVDKASEKIVWQGRGTKTLDEDASTEKREANIKTGVNKIFTKYPPAKKK